MGIDEIKKSIKRIVIDELSNIPPKRGIFKAFFFGSRVSGTAGERSDIDVGIEGSEPIPPERLRAIKSRTEALNTLYTIDIVDFSLLSDDFKKVAKQYIEEITI